MLRCCCFWVVTIKQPKLILTILFCFLNELIITANSSRSERLPHSQMRLHRTRMVIKCTIGLYLTTLYITRLYWTTIFYWAKSDYTELYWIILNFTKLYCPLPTVPNNTQNFNFGPRPALPTPTFTWPTRTIFFNL